MTIDFNSMLNIYNNNPFMNGSLNLSVQMPLSVFGSGFNMPALPSMPVMPMQIDFNKIFANIDFSKFNFNYSVPSTATYSTAQEGKCRPNVKLDQAFLNRVKQIAQRINCDYRDLLGVMNSESGLRANAQNANGGATGLIQFMPSTAKSLGTTTNALRNMTPIQQLDYVEKFYVNNIKTFGLQGKRLTAGDLYTLTFLPARVKGEVLCSAGSKEYAANKGLDANKDGQITKTELGNRVISKRVNESIFA